MNRNATPSPVTISPMSTRHALFKLLADGAFHSGTALGERLGISRAAVHKAIHALAEVGVDIHRVSGRGYRLDEPCVPLAEASIRSLLAQRHTPVAQVRSVSAQSAAVTIEVLDEVDSTNQQLLRQTEFAGARVCLAEAQSAGRGRRGRGWVATPGHNILMSMTWRFETGPAGLSGLSLAAGLAVLHALQEFGVPDAGLKWPNDILRDGRKLAGLLIDLRAEVNGPSLVVLGLGLNVHIGAADAARIDQPWTALRECLAAPVDRNRLAALLIAHLQEMFCVFAIDGFSSFHDEWQRRHLFNGKLVQLRNGDMLTVGTVEGVDANGALRVRDVAGEIRSYHSGEVSLRAAH